MKRSFFSLNKKRKKMFLKKKKGGWICFVNAPQTHKLRAFLPYFCSLRLKLSKVAMAFSSTKSQDNQINSTIIYSPVRIKIKPLKGQSQGESDGWTLCVDCGSAAEALEPPAGPSQGVVGPLGYGVLRGSEHHVVVGSPSCCAAARRSSYVEQMCNAQHFLVAGKNAHTVYLSVSVRVATEFKIIRVSTVTPVVGHLWLCNNLQKQKNNK